MQSRVDTAESTTPLFGDLEDEPHVEAGPTSPFARSREQLRVRLYFELALLDLAIIACAFFGASELRFGAIVQQQAMPMLGFVLPIFTVVAIHNRSYSQEVLARPGIGARRAAAAMAYVCALVLIAFFCLKI